MQTFKRSDLVKIQYLGDAYLYTDSQCWLGTGERHINAVTPETIVEIVDAEDIERIVLWFPLQGKYSFCSSHNLKLVAEGKLHANS